MAFPMPEKEDYRRVAPPDDVRTEPNGQAVILGVPTQEEYDQSQSMKKIAHLKGKLETFIDKVVQIGVDNPKAAIRILDGLGRLGNALEWLEKKRQGDGEVKFERHGLASRCKGKIQDVETEDFDE